MSGNEIEIKIKEIGLSDIQADMLNHYSRYQEVTKVWRIEEHKKVVKNISFIEDWDDNRKQKVIQAFKDNLLKKGMVLVALHDNKVVGFASLDGKLIGENEDYIQLLELHVSYDYRGKGIGKMLFVASVEKAKRFGAGKIYISAHSSIETMSFYASVGCKDAKWLYEPQVELEPYDCQLEYTLEQNEN